VAEQLVEVGFDGDAEGAVGGEEEGESVGMGVSWCWDGGRRMGVAYFMATCERSIEERLQHPVRNICEAETSIRSRSVCRTTLMMEL